MNNKIPIQFPLSLDLTTNGVEIDSTMNKAEDITAPLFNNSYSPLWTKEEEYSTGDIVIDKDGHKYYIKDGYLMQDDDPLFSVSSRGFNREEVTLKELSDIKDGKEAYAEFDSINHKFTIHYDGNEYESAVLFTEGAVIASRIRIVEIDGITLPILVSLYINDTGDYKVLIKRGGVVEKVLDFQFLRRTYNISGNNPTNGTVEDSSKTIQNPLIHISDAIGSNPVSVISITSNQGQPMLTSDFSWSLRAVDNSTVFETFNWSTTSIPVITQVDETVGLAMMINYTINTYTNNPCYGYVEASEPPTAVPIMTDYYESTETTSDKVAFDPNYSPQLVNIVPVKTDVIQEPDDSDPENPIPGIWRYWYQYAYEYSEHKWIYSPYCEVATQIPNLSNWSLKLDFNNSTLSYPSIVSDDGTITLQSSTFQPIQYSLSTQQSSSIEGSGLRSPENHFTYRSSFIFQIGTQYVAYGSTAPSVYQHYQAYYEIAANATAAMHPCLCDDKGNLITLGAPNSIGTRYVSNGFIIPFKARATTTSKAGVQLNIAYQSTMTYTMSTYQYYAGASYALGPNWFREVITYENVAQASRSDSSLAQDILFDSNEGVIYQPGVLQNNDQYYGSISTFPMPYNNTGSVSQLNDYYRLIYLNNLPVGISYGENNAIGTLVTEWNSIDVSFPIILDGLDLYYRSTDNVYYKISIQEKNEIALIEDRYVVVNTIDYFNCWDLYRKKKNHYATDYAHRCFAGSKSSVSGMSYYKSGILSSDVTLFTSGINSNFLVSGDGISSVSIGPQAYLRLYRNRESFNSCVQPTDTDINAIDLYYSTTGTYARYNSSYKVYSVNKVKFINPNLIGINYPVATGAYTYYSPNIFTQYLKTFANKDSVLNGNFAYQLLYANNVTPVLLFSTATQMENVDAVFVIQSQFYAVIDNKLYSLVYSNGTLVEQDAIIDVTGLQYLGNLPTIAYFYSPMNKAFYSFTGDANLTLLYETTKISQVYGTYFNTSTQALYFATDAGLFIISALSMYRLDIYGIQDIFFVNDGHSIIKTKDKLISISYYERDDYNPMRMTIRTKLWGPGTKNNTSILKWHVTLLSNEYMNEDKVVIKSFTLTDKGEESNSKELIIKRNEWDELTKSYQFQITPKLQEGQGVGFELNTPWPVAKIVAEMTDSTKQTVVKTNRMI